MCSGSYPKLSSRCPTTFDAAFMQPVFGGPGSRGSGSNGGTDTDPLLPTRALPRTEEHDLF